MRPWPPAKIRQWDFSSRGRARVWLIAVSVTLLCMAAALLDVSYTTRFMDDPARELTFASAFIVPIVLTMPLMYFFASKLRELAIAHHELTIVASHDSLTTCLTRVAFITLVDAYLRRVAEPDALRGGLLVIDADHFKSINDRFGHAAGDTALRQIALGAKSALRAADFIGRLGGEEFAVFLPRAGLLEARNIGERVRRAICELDFRPSGEPETLTVSVGGAVFQGPVSFSELFGSADACLYAAKRRGRNRVEFSAAGGAAPPPERRSAMG
jgi:diguanylate cyclase (GGDEF)-like protein